MAGVWVNIVSTPSEEFGSTSASLGCVRSDFENRSTGGKAMQIDIQYGIWIVYKKWAGNGPRILGRCRQIENPRGARRLVRYSALGIGFGQPERPAVAIGPRIQAVCGLLYCEDEEALLGAVQCVLYLHPKPSMTTTPPPPGRLSTGNHDLREH